MFRNSIFRLLKKNRCQHSRSRLRRGKRVANRPVLAESLEIRILPATINVTTFDDAVVSDGEVSLREAVIQANASAGPDEIVLPGGTFLLTRSGSQENASQFGDLDVFTDITITGAGIGETVIDAQGPTGLGERVFDLFGDADVVIRNMTITGGNDNVGGGVFVNVGAGHSATLDSVELVENVAEMNGGGVDVSQVSTLVIQDSIVTNNTAEGGGGIGISGNATIRRTIVSDNTATFAGGGISSFNTVELTESTVTNNTAGGHGGGVYSRGNSTRVSASTIAQNTGEWGGGISNINTTLVVFNSTLSGNTARMGAGAILNLANDAGNEAQAVVLQSTIVGNQQDSRGAVNTRAQNGAESAPLQIGNSILVMNTGGLGNVGQLGEGSLLSLGHNVSDDDANGLLNADADKVSVASAIVDLTLSDNGGPTLTHALLANPTIVNSGSNDLAVDPGDDHKFGTQDDVAIANDQRLDLDRIVDGTVDPGAVEFRAAVLSASVSRSQLVEDDSDSVTITITSDEPVIGDQSVQLQITGDGITADDFTLANVSVTIPSGSTSAETTLSIVDDVLVEGTETVVVNLIQPSFGVEVNVDNLAEVVISDDDTAAFEIENSSLTVSEDQTTDTFSVVLSGAPLTDVILSIASSDSSEAIVSTNELIFTNANWNEPQQVTVTGVDDSEVDGDQQLTVAITVNAERSDDLFDSVQQQDVSVTNSDNLDFHFDVDGSSSLSALTDGLLTVRFLAGFTGDALIESAVDGDGTRVTSEAITSWLASAESSVLDVDGDGRSEPLTDGILVLRYLGNFRGDALIEGAVNQDGTRTTASEIEAWLDRFVNSGGQPAAGPIPLTSQMPAATSLARHDGSFETLVFQQPQTLSPMVRFTTSSWRDFVESRDSFIARGQFDANKLDWREVSGDLLLNFGLDGNHTSHSRLRA